MKRLLTIMSLFSISFSSTAFAGQKNYKVEVNCESRINKTSLISFKSSYEKIRWMMLHPSFDYYLLVKFNG